MISFSRLKLPPIVSLSVLLVVMLAGLGTSGCSRDARAKRALERGDSFYRKHQHDRAEIEYLNALRNSPNNPKALGGLGLVYYDIGALTRAIPFIRASYQLQPNQVEIRVKNAMLASAAGERAQAREDLLFVLQKKPNHPEAPIVLCDTLTGPDDLPVIRKVLNDLPAPANAGAPVKTALAILALREGKAAEAQDYLKAALAADPTFDVPYAALSGLAMARGNRVEAEQFARKVSELAPEFSSRRTYYAQFKLQQNDAAGARTELEAIIAKSPALLGPKMLLANLLGPRNDPKTALKLLSEVIARDPANPDALLLRSRLNQAAGKYDEAGKDLDRLFLSMPNHPNGLHQQAQLQVAQGETNKAMASLMRALGVNPDYPEAALMLAELHLRQGNASEALLIVNDAIKRRPKLLPARLLLAEIFRTQGRGEDARNTLMELEKELPSQAQLPLLRGSLELQLKNMSAARAAFLSALEKSNQGLPALEQLTALDISENRGGEAVQRIEHLIGTGRADSDLYVLLGRANWSIQNRPAAEQAFRDAIRVNPENRSAYFLLARLFIENKDADKALENLNRVVEKNPKDTAAWLLTGILLEQKKDFEAAKVAYEKLLLVDPKFAPALNNLAYLYSEKFNRLPEAQELANRAREANPNDAYSADTLGWILYRQGKYAWALGLVKEAAEKLSFSGEIQYHLGLIHYKMGEEAAARAALERALALEPNFNGRDDAVARLALLAGETGPAAIAGLEKLLAQQPDDPIAQARLAQAYLLDGKSAKAEQIYESMLKTSPNNLRAIKGLAQLKLQEKDFNKAGEWARAGRKLSAEDADLARVLGLSAWATGDRRYALTLLQEAARKLPLDRDLAMGLAEAYYSQGRIQEAVTNWKASLPLLNDAAAQKSVRDTLAFVSSPTENEALAQATLTANPQAVPALMALAKTTKNASIAREHLEKALALYPEFTPAMRELTVLLGEAGGEGTKYTDWANKAREAFPADRELAKTLGLAAYRRGDFARAVGLLSEVTPTATDARLYFLLGKAQAQVKGANPKPSFERALALGLTGPDADEAKRLLK